MKIVAYDPYISKETKEDVAVTDDFAEALGQCDVVSLHMPSLGKPLLGAGEFASMRKGAIVINTARGDLIDENAMAEALSTGQLGGAGLDVLQNEPPRPDHPLFTLPNVIVTPHVAGIPLESAERMAIVSVQNVLDFFDGNLREDLIVNAVAASK